MAYSSSISDITPSSLGYRMPAEWELHEATWLAWPHNQDTWPGRLDQIPAIYVEIVRALHTQETVNLCVNDAMTAVNTRKILKDAGLDLSSVQFCEITTNDTWARDHGPIFVRRTQQEQQELA